jgi:twitching motility protein PilT
MLESKRVFDIVFEMYDHMYITDFFIDEKSLSIYYRDGTHKIDIEYNFRMIVEELISQFREGTKLEDLEKILPKRTLNFAAYVDELRLRVHVFLAYGKITLVLRLLDKPVIPISSLGYATQDVKKIISRSTGLILVSGPTGSGKTSTAVSLIEYYNQNSNKHIVTIEEPVEYILKEKKCIIHQRDVGFDCPDFTAAARDTLKEKVNILFIGEILDYAAANLALQIVATGQLVIATIHAGNCIETLERFVSFFDRNQLDLVRKTMAMFLNCIVNQRLVYREKEVKLIYEIIEANTETKALLFSDQPFKMLGDQYIKQRQEHIEDQLLRYKKF